MTSDPDLIKRSVTRDDYETEPRAGGPYGPTTLFLMPSLQPTPGLPAWWGPRRDTVLAATLDMESLWAGAIYKTVTKLASRGWVVEDADDSTRRTSRAQELLLNAGGAGGWIQFLGQHIQDYLTQDNGAFVEIIRASSAAGSRILGLQHLDAQRCWRTGDPDVPVLYTDLKGRQHEMREHQVLLFADLPSPRAEMRGVGRCAASRAWRKIHLMTSLEVYMDEKVSGARPQSIYIVNGAASHQIENAVKAAETKQLAAGYTIYRGAVVISAIKPDATLGVVEIPLASIPDKTDVGREREEARLIYAHCIGIDLQELQPQPAGLNSGMTAVVLAEKAKGQGLASWAKQWEHQTSHRVLPASTTFAWSERDLGEQKQQADIESVRAATRAQRIETGEISVEQARQLAADAGDYPKEWLPQDTTPAGVLEDDEKPAEIAPQQEPQAANPLAMPAVAPVLGRRTTPRPRRNP